MKILVEIKNVYGKETIYPACEKSNLFCNIAEKKTFTQSMIKNVKALGYEIEVKQDIKTL